MQPNAASMEDQKSRKPIKLFKQIITKDSHHRNAEEEACARELLELGQESGSPLSIVVQDNLRNKNNNINGSNVKRVVMKVPHNSLNQVKQNNFLVNFPNLDGTVDEDDGDEPSTHHDVSKGIEAKTSRSPTTSISGVTQTLLNHSPSSAQFTNSESSLVVCSRSTSINCADVVSVPHLSNQNENCKSEYQKSDNDTISKNTIENCVISPNHSSEKTTKISSSEPHFSNQFYLKHSDRVISDRSEMNEHKSNSVVLNSASNSTNTNELSKTHLMSSNVNSVEAINSSNMTSPICSSSIPMKPIAPSKTKALSLFSIESLVSNDSSGVRYSSKQLASPVPMEKCNDMNPVNLSTKSVAQSQIQSVSDLIIKPPSISLQTSSEVKDSQTLKKVAAQESLELDKHKTQVNTSCSITADDEAETPAKSIFRNRNISRLPSSTFTLLPNFNNFATEASKNEDSKMNDTESKATVSETVVTDTMPKDNISKDIKIDEKRESDKLALRTNDTITPDTSCSQSSDKVVKTDTLKKSDDQDIIIQNQETASEKLNENLLSKEDSASLANSKISENDIPKPADDITSSEVNQLHLDVKENTQSLKSVACPLDIAASSQTTLLSSTKENQEENQSRETRNNCDVSPNDSKVSEAIQESSKIEETTVISPNPEMENSLDEEPLMTTKHEVSDVSKLKEWATEDDELPLHKSEPQTQSDTKKEEENGEISNSKDENNVTHDVDRSQSPSENIVKKLIGTEERSCTLDQQESINKVTHPQECALVQENNEDSLEIKKVYEPKSVVPQEEESKQQNPEVNKKGHNDVDEEQNIVIAAGKEAISSETLQDSSLPSIVHEDKFEIQSEENSETDLPTSPTPANLTYEPINPKLISNSVDSESKKDLTEQNVQCRETPSESATNEKSLELSQPGSHIVSPNLKDAIPSESTSIDNIPSLEIDSTLSNSSEKMAHHLKDISETSDDNQLVISLPSSPKQTLQENAVADSDERVNETSISSNDDNLLRSNEDSTDKGKSQEVSRENDEVEKNLSDSEKDNSTVEETKTIPHSDSQPFDSSEKISLDHKNDFSVEIMKGDLSPKEHLSEGALDMEISETKDEKSPCTTTCDTSNSYITLTTFSSSSKETDVPSSSSNDINSETLKMQLKETASEKSESCVTPEFVTANSNTGWQLPQQDHVAKEYPALKDNETNSDAKSEIESILIKDNTKSEASDHDPCHSSSSTTTSSSGLLEQCDKNDIVSTETRIEPEPNSSNLSDSHLNSYENNNVISLHSSDQTSTDNSSTLSEPIPILTSSSLATKSIVPIVSQSINNENNTSNHDVEKDSRTALTETQSINKDIPTDSTKEIAQLSKVIYLNMRRKEFL